MSTGIKKIDENVIAPGRSLSITNSSIKDNSNFQIGTLKTYSEDFGLRFKYAQNDYRLFDSVNILEEYSITDSLIGNQEITTRAIKDLNVTTDKINDRNVTRTKIEFRAVGENELDNDSVKTIHISNEQVTTEKLANLCVTKDKIGNEEVVAGKLGKDSVMNINIANEAITTNKILNGAVTNDKILDGTIKNEKIKDFEIKGGNEVGISKIAEKTITSFNVADNTLTTAKFANGSVTGEKIANGTITSSNIAAAGVETVNIAPLSIMSEQLKDEAVTTEKVANKTITKDKLSDDIFTVVDNAVVYEQDEQGNNCVRIKDGNYLSVMGGNVTVNGTITADRVYNMAYSDLAEGYTPGEDGIEPGEDVYVREDGKVYKKGLYCVGVVSNEYALCLGASNEELASGSKIAVGLIGRIHVKTRFDAKIGQEVIAKNGKIVGRALESTSEMNKDENGYYNVLTLVFPS